MIEEKDYLVTLTIRATGRVSFAPIERDRPITKADAIDNAIGAFDYGTYNAIVDFFEQEGFSVALPIDGEAREID